MIYIGGYRSDHNVGIYELNDDLSLNCHICEDEGASYFDLYEGIYTISRKDEKGGVAHYDHLGHLLSSIYFDLKPGCFIEVHDELVYVAYYHDARVQVLDLDLNLVHEFIYPDGSKAHQVFFMKDKIGIVLLGLDKIVFYDYDWKFLFELDFPEKSGPRHGVVSHDEKELYVISELSNELFIVDLNTCSFKQVLSIKEGNQPTTGAALRLSKDGHHLYTSTRGQNVLKHFELSSIWKEVQCIQLKGDLPRDFQLFDDCLIVGYQNSNLVEKVEVKKHWIGRCVDCVYYDKIVCVK